MVDKGSQEEKLLQDAMRGVLPLNTTKKSTYKHPTPTLSQIKITPKDAFNDYSIDYSWRDGEQNKPIDRDERVEFAHSGVDLSIIKSSKQPIDYLIDLHGMNLDQAAVLVHETISKAQKTNSRKLKIIHGKGKSAILKTAVISWLQNHPLILGFCSAALNDGGSGCLYVLVKRRKK